MLTGIELICLGIMAAYGMSALYWAGEFFVSRYLISRRTMKKIKVLKVNSSDMIDALNWGERDNEELREELELSGYPKRLIKKTFDKNSLKALDKLIEIADKRIAKRAREGTLRIGKLIRK